MPVSLSQSAELSVSRAGLWMTMCILPRPSEAELSDSSSARWPDRRLPESRTPAGGGGGTGRPERMADTSRSAGSPPPLSPAGREGRGSRPGHRRRCHLQDGRGGEVGRVTAAAVTCRTGGEGKSAGSPPPLSPAGREGRGSQPGHRRRYHLQDGRGGEVSRVTAAAVTCRTGGEGKSAGSPPPLSPAAGGRERYCEVSMLSANGTTDCNDSDIFQ